MNPFRYSPMFPAGRVPSVRGGVSKPYEFLAHGRSFATISAGDLQEMANGLVRVRADYSHSPAIAVSVPPSIGQALKPPPGTIESFDFNFGLRRVLGGTVAWGSGPARMGMLHERHGAAPAPETRWIQYAELRELGGASRLAPLDSGAENTFPLPSGFASLLRSVDSHDGIYLLQPDSPLIQVRLNPGHAIGVYDYGALNDERLAGAPAKSGEVWWLDFIAGTGQIVFAHMKQGDSKLLIQLPFDDLDYDPERKCFMIRKPPSATEDTGFAAAVALARTQETRIPGRFH